MVYKCQVAIICDLFQAKCGLYHTVYDIILIRIFEELPYYTNEMITNRYNFVKNSEY